MRDTFIKRNILIFMFYSALPLYVVFIGLVGLVWGLDVVALPDHSDVTLYITFTPRCYVIRIRQDGPFVVKLMFWDGCKSISKMRVCYDQLLV